MPFIQRAAFVASLGLLVALLAGLFVRRLYRVCYSFPAYLMAVLAGDVLMFAWPDRFYTWGFWTVKETLYALLKLAIAIEVSALAYQAFPSARAAVRRVILGVLAALLAFLVIGVPYDAELPTLARELQRRTANGIALVFCATWALVLYYRLPLHRLHRAILRGLVPYLLVFASANTLTLVFGWDVRQAVNVADAAAWALMLAYWCWVVWRPARPDPPFMRQLQRWRARI